ncbi:MAG: GNAT family N-acetyltransferase [Bacteroidota bacterium]
MEIGNAIFNDLPSILELQKLCYRENAERYNDYQIPPMTQTIKDLEDEFNHNVILKAEDQSKIIGSLRAYEKNRICYIGRVIVHPDYQNKGIGTKLMIEIERRFPDVSKYELFTGYKDEKNIYFYGKLGYKIFKEENLGDKIKLVFLEKIRIG